MSPGPQPRSETPTSAFEEVSLFTAFAYGLPRFGVNVLYFLVLVMFMNYATDVLLISAGTIGAIFFLSKIWDAISDPIAGYLSDRTNSRFGRRKPWLLASSIPLFGCALAMWAPPESLSSTELIAWVAVAVFGFYTAHTLFEIPHLAIGAELSTELRQRNRVYGARHIFGTVGMFAAFAVGANALEDLSGAREAARWITVVVGTLTVASLLGCVAWLPRERPDYAKRGGSHPYGAIRDVLRNPHARLILIVWFIETLGTSAIGVLFPYAFRYVIKRPDLLAEVLVLYTTVSLLSTPIWMWLGRRFEKHKLWLVAMSIQWVGYSLLLFIAEGRVALMFVSQLLAGFGAGCAATLGHSLKADIVDYDEFKTGERKEGTYFAVWNFFYKLATGVMIGVTGLVLQLVGFEPGVEQTESTQNAIRLLIGGMPLMGFSIGILVFRRFRFSRADHAEIRREIDAREGGSGA